MAGRRLVAAPPEDGRQLIRLRPAPPRGVPVRPPLARLRRRVAVGATVRAAFRPLDRAGAFLAVRPAVLLAAVRVPVGVVRVLPAALVRVPALALPRVAAAA